MQIAYFYLLEDDSLKAYTRSVCRLIDQTWSEKLSIYLYCETEEEAHQFNDDLWTFQDIRFVPHELISTQTSIIDKLPICVIGSKKTVQHPSNCQVLFNLTKTVPDFFQEYQQIIEVVPVNETARTASRARYKQYQRAQYQIKTQSCDTL